MANGELLRDQPADRHSAQRQFGHAEVIQQAGKVIDMIVEGIVTRRRVAQAMAALVIGEDVVAIGQQRDHVVPDARVSAQRVDQRQHGRAFAAAQAIVQHN